jgi:hypothetical protein
MIPHLKPAPGKSGKAAGLIYPALMEMLQV